MLMGLTDKTLLRVSYTICTNLNQAILIAIFPARDANDGLYSFDFEHEA